MHAPRRWAVLALAAACWLLPASTVHATTIVGAVQTNAHEGQIGVGWRTDQAATTEVAWDTQPRGSWAAYANSWSYAGKDSATHGHTFTVAQPGITYFVRVRSEGLDGLTVESPELQVTVAAHFLDRPTGRYVPNQRVLDMEASGSTMYVVGDFREFRPAATGGGKFDATSGDLDLSFPQFERDTYHSAAATQVTDVEPDGEGGWYVVGSFDRVAGWSRNNAVHVLADGGIDPFWAPRIGNSSMFPRDIELVGGVLYVVGEFTDVEGGTVRNRAAAFDAETGALLPWNPDLNGRANSIDVIGSTAYLGGAFTQAAGSTPRNRAASVNLTDGALNPWNPNLNAEVRVVRASGSAVFVGGDFTTVGGVSRNRLAAVDPATGAVTGWAGPSITGGPLPRVYALELDGTRLFVGGYFTTVGASSRNSLASVDATTGAVNGWNPNVTGWIEDIAVNGASVYVAGAFGTIGGQSRSVAVRWRRRRRRVRSSWSIRPTCSFDIQRSGAVDDRRQLGGRRRRRHSAERWYAAHARSSRRIQHVDRRADCVGSRSGRECRRDRDRRFDRLHRRKLRDRQQRRRRTRPTCVVQPHDRVGHVVESRAERVRRRSRLGGRSALRRRRIFDRQSGVHEPRGRRCLEHWNRRARGVESAVVGRGGGGRGNPVDDLHLGLLRNRQFRRRLTNLHRRGRLRDRHRDLVGTERLDRRV